MKDIHKLTPTPPMGWNSYDSFGCFANEKRLLENLQVFVEKLKPAGYEYFVLDAGWFREYKIKNGCEFASKNDTYNVKYDEYGRPLPSLPAFPNGIKPVADACHAAGVKFGIHMMRGIARVAVEANTKIKGSDSRAQDIADTSDTCQWCPDNYGIDMSKHGAQEYYDSIVEMLAGWGVDFIKYDDIVPSPPEVDAVVKAIEKCDREIVLSLSPGNNHKEDGWDAYSKANLIRISGDVWDNRGDFHWVFQRWEEFYPRVEKLPPGCWLDQDMIPFGELQVWNPEKDEQIGHILMNGKGSRRMSCLNEAQKRTFITMRAIGASPLFMGGHLPNTDDYSFELITDKDMLECNQNGVVGQLLEKNDKMCIWKTASKANENSGWIGIFNRQENDDLDITLNFTQLGIPENAEVYDVWNKKTLEDLNVTIPPDDVLFVRYGKKLFRELCR